MKLIALDMDGTVLTTDKKVTPATIDAIAKAKEAGHIVMICSGRAHDALTSFLKANNLANLPISGSNGAATWVDGKIIHQVAMAKPIVASIFNWLDQNLYPFKVYTSKGIFAKSNYLTLAEQAILANEAKAKENQLAIANNLAYEQNNPAIIINSFSELATAPDIEIFKLFALTVETEKKQALREFLATFTKITVTSSYPTNVEIMAFDGHKATGLTQVANYYNIPLEDTVAIGDNFNDLPMLEIAGLSIAMANAEAEVKEICDVITKSNDEDGVAHAIKTYVL